MFPAIRDGIEKEEGDWIVIYNSVIKSLSPNIVFG